LQHLVAESDARDPGRSLNTIDQSPYLWQLWIERDGPHEQVSGELEQNDLSRLRAAGECAADRSRPPICMVACVRRDDALP
jgi:hypothetical protein